jgi:hypothetical protein
MAGASSPNVAKDPAFCDEVGQTEMRNGISITTSRETPEGKLMWDRTTPIPHFRNYGPRPVYPDLFMNL